MPHDSSHQTRILDILQRLSRNRTPQTTLLGTELNYDLPTTTSISRGDWNQSDKSNTSLTTRSYSRRAGVNSGFPPHIYTRLDSDRLPLTAERPIISRLLKDYPYALFMFSNSEQTDWHFVNAKFDEEHPEKRRLLPPHYD